MTIVNKDKITKGMEEKHRRYFNNGARYVGSGIYSFDGLYASSTRTLFLMYVAQEEFNETF